jgi:wyosine [tRNA(Phe)-imidazoG37] synthetase (radical SAM superfamily)
MSTFLFDEIIFGPVKSRRLGVSLGINLLPTHKKICNFNCVYCECGWTGQTNVKGSRLPDRAEVYKALENKLVDMKGKNEAPDVITYAGNGEPTLHPEFAAIIEDSIFLRDKYFPESRIAVLSNSTTITSSNVRNALMKADMNILKLDSAIDDTIKKINQPRTILSAFDLINDLASFNGHVIIQTLFLRGTHNGEAIDNTTPLEVSLWLKALEKIKPSEVMIYTISRDIPEGSSLKKVPLSELNLIASAVNKIGIKTQISG